MKLHCLYGLLMSWGLFPLILPAQATTPNQSIPPILMLRAEESYTSLREDDSTRFFLRGLKYIPLHPQKTLSLSLGGEFRGRLEHYTHANYSPENLSYLSQRLSLHAAILLGRQVRLFAELYHGATSGGIIPLQSDLIDIHQAFFEWTFGGGSEAQIKGSLRIGRQELGFGTSRLVGIREGPNLRRSFDMGRLTLRKGKSSLQLVYGKEVQVSSQSFDNRSNLWQAGAQSPTLWGLYVQKPLYDSFGKLDLYYLGFHTNMSRFNDVGGEEIRHVFGARSYGQKGKLAYNTEAILQIGKLAESFILAFNLETDWTFQLSTRFWKPTPGLRLDWSSGDARQNDGRIGTFNPFFVNPAIYSLAAVNTPANVISLHPNLRLSPSSKISVYMDYALFYRTRLEDGLYTPPRFLAREAAGVAERHIGDVLGIQLSYEPNRNIKMDVRSSYFLAGRFIQATGDAENTFYIAPTLSLKF